VALLAWAPVGRGRGRAIIKRSKLLLVSSAATLIAAGCSRNEPSYGGGYTDVRKPQAPGSRFDPRYGTSSSERLFSEGQSIPKGGGTYKLGVPYRIAGRWYVPAEDPNYDRTGTASWYGSDFHGRKTANGEVFDMWALTAAHPTLPIPSYAYVTNLDNGRTVLVRINDRGPYAHDRLIDLSRMTARMLGTETQGLGRVRVRYAGRAPLDGNDAHERRFLASQPWANTFAGNFPPGRMSLGATP
jgi:rare lipoprotein A